METVAFYSYKGGVGRSLLLVNSARFLALTGRRVVALDLDFEAPGLHYKFNVDTRIQTGAVRLLSRSLDDDLPTLDEVREACVEVPTAGLEQGWLRLLAAGPAPKRAYWADLRRLDEQLRANAEVGLLEAVVDLQARIEEAWNPDVLLIDARTGITGLGGIATMALSDRVVLVTTRAKESVDGVRAVADSLRATPTLRRGERKLKFVVSRVQGTETMSDRELREVLGDYFELPHDSVDGGAERKIGGHDAPTQPHERATQQSLLFKTLEWIRRMWPAEAAVAEQAQRRLVEVERAWLELTKTDERIGRWSRDRSHWTTSQLQTGIRVHAPDGRSRVADIIATLDDSGPTMVIEYLQDEDHAAVAQWWAQHAHPRVVALLAHDPKRSLYGVDAKLSVSASTRWDLPSPRDFELLDDPTDPSIARLLQTLQYGPYLERLVREWVRATVLGAGPMVMPWRPGLARKILDGLAAVDGEDGSRVLWVCSRGSSRRNEWTHIDDDYLDREVHEGLCAPLCWRIAPQAFIKTAEKRQSFGPTPAFHGLRRLAGFIGLDYDPDAHFRREGPKLVGPDDDIYPMRDAFAAYELTYEWSDLPLSSEHVAAKLAYHGYLGSYSPATGHVVLAGPTIEAVAATLGRAPRYIGSVALLHLSVLGLLHNGIDLDGLRWEGFSTGDPSAATVVLAQFFVHRFLLELADAHLTDAFEALTERQAPRYRAWRHMGHVSLEAARAWMIAMRRGTQGCVPVDLDALLQPDG